MLNLVNPKANISPPQRITRYKLVIRSRKKELDTKECGIDRRHMANILLKVTPTHDRLKEIT